MSEMMNNTPPPPPGEDEWRFVDELRSYPPVRTRWRTDRQASEGELDLQSGLEYVGGFNDPNGRLTTAEDGLRHFLKEIGLAKKGGVPISAEVTEELPVEGFRLAVGATGIRVQAGETEGVRRAIYFLKDQLTDAEGPFLKMGAVERRPWLKNRVSRCFFGPIKRPPFNRDELMDDVDYYPDAYLDRLASEGVNGLWLTVEFRDLRVTSSFTPTCPDAEKRLAKLRRVVDKCARYGVKIWLFCIEPACFAAEDPMLKDYPELRGAPTGNGKHCFCPSSETADQYLCETTRGIFENVPGLGGLINISHGERGTTCLSSIHGQAQDPVVDCPRCGGLPLWRILNRSLGAMRRGMREADPSTELISWFYAPYAGTHADWMLEMANHMPDDVIIQYNFESGVLKSQLGKPRVGGDYWQSEVGPSANFARVADRATRAGTPLSAKLQVGCGHEVATIPFVPVPSLLHRKYKKMRRLGCSSVTQCWYFGNYPGVMNRAAGALAFDTFDQSEAAFLLELARPDWGAAAETVVEAWGHLADGYADYPLTTMFQYYGPMHDGVVWPLYLTPALKPLAPTWLTKDYPSGDAVGECLSNAFTLSEALALCERMVNQWERGLSLFQSLREDFRHDPERLRDIDLVEALDVQFKSGRNILRFYLLRSLLINDRTDAPLTTLKTMRRLVEEEIGHSQQMTRLCERDSRLGYHSESETYKYYPDKLRWRVDQLRRLLTEAFPEIQRQLEAGERFPERVPDRPVYHLGEGWRNGERFRWRLDDRDGDLALRAECQVPVRRERSIIDFHLYDKAAVMTPWRFRCCPEISAEDSKIINVSTGEIIYGDYSDTHWSVDVVIPSLSWDMDPARKPAYFSVANTLRVEGEPSIEESWPPAAGPTRSRLGLSNCDPERTARLENE